MQILPACSQDWKIVSSAPPCAHLFYAHLCIRTLSKQNRGKFFLCVCVAFNLSLCQDSVGVGKVNLLLNLSICLEL